MLPDRARFQWINDDGPKFERGLQIYFGAITTLTAGFLSQVWSSAQKLMLIALAEYVNIFGSCFVIAMSLSALRLGGFRRLDQSSSFLKAWVIIIFLLFIIVTVMTGRVGSDLLKFAHAAED